MGERFVATINSAGEVALPRALLEAWGLKPGDQVAFEDVGEHSSLLQPNRKTSFFERIEEFRLPALGRSLSQQDIEDAISEEMREQEERSRGT